MTALLVFTGGDRVDRTITDALPVDAVVVGVDSGIDHALAAGRVVDVAIGDFDSVTAAGLRAATATASTVEQHPAAKDESDLELALAFALDRQADHVIVVGGHGGRVDHFLMNALLLMSDRYRSMRIEAWFGASRAYVLRPSEPLVLEGQPGEVVSLMAVQAAAVGVTTTGLRYPLDRGALSPGSTRGLSNELVAPVATVSLIHGCLLVVRPAAGVT